MTDASDADAPVICRLDVVADPAGTATAAATVEQVARGLGFHPGRVTQVRSLTHALADQAAQRLEGGAHHLVVEIATDAGSLHVSVCDQGLPIGSAPGGLPQDLVALGFADDLHVATRGAEGNVSDFHVVLPDADWRGRLEGEVEVLSQDVALADPDEELTVRQLTADDAEELTRCFWRSWGYGYPYPDVYRPDLLSALLRNGERVAFGAVRAGGEVVGAYHFDLMAPWAKVCHTGGAIVDPRYRSRGLLQQIQVVAVEEAIRRGLWATQGEPVLSHPRTQKATTRSGGIMVGLILSIRPAVALVGFDGTGEERTSTLSSLVPRDDVPPRKLWLPTAHRAIIERCLAELGAEAELPMPEAHRAGATPKSSVVETKIQGDWGLGSIVVHEVGEDLIEVVDEQTSALIDSGAVTVHLDLPLNQPATAVLGSGLGELGYVYCTWLPERYEARPGGADLRPGDGLRLQRLVRPQIDSSAWQLDAEHTKWLVDQVLGQLDAVGAHDRTVRRNRARMQGIYSVLGG